MFAFLIVLTVIFSLLVSARDTKILNWGGTFYGCGLSGGEVGQLNAIITGNINNTPTDCKHFSDTEGDSRYYCDLVAKEWKDATTNYNGNDFADGTYIDTLKSTNGEFVKSVINGGFEEGDGSLVGWQTTEGGGAVYEIVSDEKNSGTYSAKISGGDGSNQAYYYQIININPGADYILSGYIKTDNHNDARLYLFEPDSWTTISTSRIISGDTDWAHVTAVFNSGSRSKVKIALRSDSQNQGEVVWVDDIRLELANNSIDVLTACCPNSHCWDGNVCVKGEPSAEPDSPYAISEDGSEAYNCILVGATPDWKTYKKKSKHNDASDTGYCAPDECWAGETNKCVDVGTYLDDNGIIGQGDNNCEPIYAGSNITDTKWTSRTKLIAQHLFWVASEVTPIFVLYCDEPGKALNNVRGLDSAKVNNFCVIKFPIVPPNAVVFGTSINSLSGSKEHILEKIGVDTTACDGITDDGFTKCGTTDVYYNPTINAVVYSSDSPDSVTDVIQGWLDAAIGWFQGLFTGMTTPEPIPFLNDLKQFKKVYVYKSLSKEVYAVLESDSSEDKDKLFVQYRGFYNTDICGFIDSYKLADPSISSLGCEPENPNTWGEYGVIASEDEGELDSIWQDITSKLRIKTGGPELPTTTTTVGGGTTSSTTTTTTPSGCITSISCGQSLPGTWVTTCQSSGGGTKYAKYYTFNLASNSLVTIDLESVEDTYMHVLMGEGMDGPVVNADNDGGDGTNSRIIKYVRAGDGYTIEATTYNVERTGDFTVKLACESVDCTTGCYSGCCRSIALGPCPINGRDCDNDYECAGDLICIKDMGGDVGCDSDIGYCAVASSTTTTTTSSSTTTTTDGGSTTTTTTTVPSTTTTTIPDGSLPTVFYASKDVELGLEVGANAFFDDEFIVIGNFNWPSRALLQFNLASIPSGTPISSAEINLFVYGTHCDVQDTIMNIKAEKVSSEWIEFDGDIDTVPASTPISEPEVPVGLDIYVWKTFDITSLAPDWISKPLTNHGVLLKSQQEDTNCHQIFVSKDDDTQTQRHPKLIITYS